jgi:hypothetical protein
LTAVLSKLASRFGTRFQVSPAPTARVSESLIPDYVVHVEGAEFHDRRIATDDNDRPRTMHSPDGFAIGLNGHSPANDVQRIQIADLLLKPTRA